MATLSDNDFQRKLAGNFKISPADLARLSPEQQQLYQQKMLQAAAPASLQGAFGAPQGEAGGVPVDHAHGATLAQIAANQQAQLEQLNKAGMLGGVRQSPKNTNYDHKPGLEYLRSADEVAARQDAWQQHTGAKDALRMQSARDAVSAKKDEQSKRVSQSVFGPDGVANTAGGGRVIMLPDGSFGYSTPAREQGSPGEVGMTDAMTGLNPSKMYQAPGGGMSLQEANSFGPVDKKSSAPYQAAQMDAENVRAQARKEAALNMLSHAVPPQSQVVTNGSPGFIPSAEKWFVENPGFAQTMDKATKSVGGFFQGLKEAPSVTMDWLKTKFGSDAPPEGPKAEPAPQVTSTPGTPQADNVVRKTPDIWAGIKALAPLYFNDNNGAQSIDASQSMFNPVQEVGASTNPAGIAQKAQQTQQEQPQNTPPKATQPQVPPNPGKFVEQSSNNVNAIARWGQNRLAELGNIIEHGGDTLRTGIQQGLDYTGASMPLRGIKKNLGIAKDLGLVKGNSPAMLDWLLNLVMPDGSMYAEPSYGSQQNVDLMQRGFETNYGIPLSGLQTNLELLKKAGIAPDVMTEIIPALMEQGQGAIDNTQRASNFLKSLLPQVSPNALTPAE